MPERSRRVVVIAIDVPRVPARHAGGRYLDDLRRFYDSIGASAVFVAPRHGAEADLRTPSVGSIIELGGRWRWAIRLDGAIRRAIWHLAPTMPDFRLLLGVLFSRRLRAVLRKADVVDLQWTEIGWLIGPIRRLNTSARITVTMHDVLPQKYQRRMAIGLSGSAGRWRRALRHSVRLTDAICAKADAVAVLSAKDAELLRTVRPDVIAVPAVAIEPGDIDDGARDGLLCMFSGAMHRPENDDAARWLIEAIWPRVVAEVPGARLSIVGSNPSDAVIAAAKDAVNVNVTGYVDDLLPYYSRAAVSFVPLRAGAGIKFKTVDALLSESLVIATPVGAEGVGPDRWFWCVSDDPIAIAASAARALSDPATARTFAQTAAHEARAFYNPRSQTASFEALYFPSGAEADAAAEDRMLAPADQRP